MARTSGKVLFLIDFFSAIYYFFVISLSLYSSDFLMTWVCGKVSGYWSIFYWIIFCTFSFLFLVFYISLIYSSLPRLKEGFSQMPNHPTVLLWVIKFYIKKPLTLPLIHHVLHSFHTLTYVVYKLMGMNISYGFQMSSNVDIRDPELFVFGKDSTIGGDVIITGHFMIRENLVLKKVVLANNVMIGAGAKILNGVKIGAHTAIGHGCEISHDVSIGTNCILGAKTVLGTNVVIGNRVRTKEGTFILKGSVIADESYIEGIFDNSVDYKNKIQ